jgi:hypothetical protein
MTNTRDEMVVVAVKTPLMPRATSLLMDGRMTLRQSVDRLRRTPPKDQAAAEVIQQLDREAAGAHDYLVVTKTGEVRKADPDGTTLVEVAVPREVRTAQGVKTVPTAAIELQAYAPVGHAG